jgi:hypothetical protein
MKPSTTVAPGPFPGQSTTDGLFPITVHASASILDHAQQLALLVNADGERWVTTLAQDAVVPKTMYRRGELFRTICTARPTQTTLTMATWWASVPNGAGKVSISNALGG